MIHYIYHRKDVTGMQAFMNEDFLLRTDAAKKLYHDYAETMPIIDYHCHLKPEEIALDKKYRSITEVWLGGDHYKWRAMRGRGVSEKLITGDASDHDKFIAWARTLPYLIGNPLYHWTHLELQRYFGIYEPLSEANAEAVWEKCNALLAQDGFSARGLILRSNVKAVCTTDDPIDDLRWHKMIAADEAFPVGVYPTFRPDKAVNITKPTFKSYISALADAAGMTITTVSDVKAALSARLDVFCDAGCRISDHGLDYVPFADDAAAAEAAFAKAMAGDVLTKYESDAYQTAILLHCGREYAARGIAMQLHFAALRDNSRRMFPILGPDTGFDAISDDTCAVALSNLLGTLDLTNELPKTVLYSLNPSHNELLISLATCFNGNEDGILGKVQLGSGWWFLDQKDGMVRQLNALAHIGVLSAFVGMLTDSRSFLSYTRHEYFRRILCNYLGDWMDAGEIPADFETIGGIVKDISFNNTNRYFGFGV